MAIVPEMTRDFSERTELNSMRYAMTVRHPPAHGAASVARG